MKSVILFAHGSRDPLWSAPIEAVAACMRRLEPQVQVRCAYLELTPPSLPEVAADMIAYGASQIRVVPLFLGVGRHAREDLPVLMNALCQSHPQVVFKLEPAVGENPAIVEALARTALG